MAHGCPSHVPQGGLDTHEVYILRTRSDHVQSYTQLILLFPWVRGVLDEVMQLLLGGCRLGTSYSYQNFPGPSFLSFPFMKIRCPDC